MTVTTTAELQGFLDAPTPPWQCVWATADFCVPCKRLIPGWSSIAHADGERHDEFVGRVAFAVADLTLEADEALDSQSLSETLHITTLPTFVLFKSGREVSRAEGAAHKRPARRLHEMLKMCDGERQADG